MKMDKTKTKKLTNTNPNKTNVKKRYIYNKIGIRNTEKKMEPRSIDKANNAYFLYNKFVSFHKENEKKNSIVQCFSLEFHKEETKSRTIQMRRIFL